MHVDHIMLCFSPIILRSELFMVNAILLYWPIPLKLFISQWLLMCQNCWLLNTYVHKISIAGLWIHSQQITNVGLAKCITMS